ncbi:MAG TPA: hypothetical protein PKD37_06010 [Oligoflexia bacterium]|nr:hypothetical protein [Oligoflexia bacterium]HMP27515.1 hypothetical protein [Oligoflexia bacterium]
MLNREPIIYGKVIGLRAGAVIASLPFASQGAACEVQTNSGRWQKAEIIGAHNTTFTLALYENGDNITTGNQIRCYNRKPTIAIPRDPIGGIFDCCGELIGGTLKKKEYRKIFLKIEGAPPESLSRPPIDRQFQTKIPAIDSLLPLGVGQRVGIIAPAGAGKSTLLAEIVKNNDFSIKVIALIGERGREVREFIDSALGLDALSQSVLIVSTSDESAIRRALAVKTATAIAEHFRDQGKDVLLVVDSLTRVARAIREIGLERGEIPVRQGYTSSVYTTLPQILERTGTSNKGSITAFYSLLAASEDQEDPLVEEIKSLLDGHIWLSTKVALEGIRPAIDFNRSISRVAKKMLSPVNNNLRVEALRLLARYWQERELALLGGRADPELQALIDLKDQIAAFLSNRPENNFLTPNRLSIACLLDMIKNQAYSYHQTETNKQKKIKNFTLNQSNSLIN